MPLTALRPTLLGALAPTLALLTSLTPSGAQALGLGRPQVHSTLGQPLDVSVPLTLAEGERLGDSCLRAEVSAGDARVPAGLLQLRVEGEPGQQRLRLQSLVRVEEPALRITLALGCPLRLTREFNAFIDPPATSTATAVPPLPAPPPPSLPAVTPPAAEPVARTAGDAPPAPVVKPRPRPKPPRQTGPRLVLERPEVLVGQTPRPARAAASAPEVELTPELEAQIAQLEQTVAQLRAELQGRQAAAASAAQTAAAAPPAPAAVAASVPASATAATPAPAPVRGVRASPYSDPMTWLLTLGLSLLAGAVAFYGSRWRDERRRRERAYWRALHSAEGGRRSAAGAPASGIAPAVAGGAAALPDEGQHTITKPQPRPMAWPPVTPEAPQANETIEPTASQAMRTQPMPSQAVAAAPVLSEELPAELTTADELLDLQQQVDFLQLLGQHEAATDLLAARLARGNAGAMPYLMLMELCQHRGEPELFAQRAMQFEQRFGVMAPQWAQSLARGRSLDACPSVIAHLQVVWGDPAAAMKMLQELLARGGGPGVSSFELPAYRDLLLLYSVARDLFEAGLRGEGVDLMLPLDSSFGSEA
jgi:hypothetical protein